MHYGWCSKKKEESPLSDANCPKAKYTELPDISHPREIREAKDYVAASETPYGPLLHMLELITVQNTTIQLEVANPLALL